MSPWTLLVAAGLLEIVWATGLKVSEGFTRPLASVVTVIAAGISFWMLAMAMKQLPAGTAYAVWTGIGAVGVAILGIVFFSEAATPWRIGGILLIVSGIAALNLG